MLLYHNNHRYNTETARKVGTWDNGCGTDCVTNYDYVSKTLYCKRTGEYFLVCDGGARTPYFSPHVEPIGYRAARVWAHEHLEHDAFASEFDAPPAGRVVTSLSLDPSTLARLRQLALADGLPMGRYLDKLIASLCQPPD